MHNATVHGSDGTFQFFGIPSATTGAAIKQGWGADNPSGMPDFNSTGFVNGDRYAAAILTQGPGYGTPIANMLTSEARILMPGGLIVNTIPVGRIDHITRVGRSTFSVDGWAFDPSSTGASTRVDVYVGSSGVPTQANIPRPDVAAAYGLSGNAHGFDLDVAAPSGTSRLCVYAIGIDTTVNTLLGCSMVTVGVPTGHIDVFRVGGSITIAGWAFAPGDPDVSTRVDFYVGGKSYSTIASGSRPDVAQAYGLTSAAHGFGFNVQLPVGNASACVYAIGTDTTLNENLGCQAVSGPTLPVAVVDSISPVAAGMTTLTGWAFDPTNGSASSRVDVYVGPAGFSTLANIARPDVQAAYALTSAAHGFSLKVAVPPGVSQLCVYAIALQPAQHSLSGCTAVTG